MIVTKENRGYPLVYIIASNNNADYLCRGLDELKKYVGIPDWNPIVMIGKKFTATIKLIL